MSGSRRPDPDVSMVDATLGVEGVLARPRRRLDRLTPEAAADAFFDGALLVDIRPRPGGKCLRTGVRFG